MNFVPVVCQCAIALLTLSAVTPALMGQVSNTQVLHATTYNSHFPEAGGEGEAFNGMGVSHDGTVYYVISSGKYDVAGQMYSFNPKTKAITHLADLSDAVGAGKIKAVPQGKNHVDV